MRKTVSLFLLCTLFTVMLAAPAGAMGTKTYYVDTNSGTGGDLIMRAAPDKNAAVVTTIPYGTALEIAGFENGFGFCSYKNYTGYVMARYLSETVPGPSKKQQGGGGSGSTSADTALSNMNSEYSTMAKNILEVPYEVTVTPSKTTTRCNLRWGPSTSVPVIRSDVVYGEKLTVLAEGNSWLMVRDEKTGLVGYFSRSLTNISTVKNNTTKRNSLSGK